MLHPTTFPTPTSTDHPKALLRESAVERDYGLSGSYLRKRRWLRLEPAYIRIGRAIYYHRSDLEKFIAANRVEPGTPAPGEVRQ
jgi:hypothetical protein